MSFWQILGRFAVSDKGETLQKISDTTSVSSDGTTYTRMGRPLLGRMGLCSPRWATSAPTAAPEWEAPQPELGPFSTSVMSGRIQERGLQILKKGSVTMMIRGDY